MKPIRFRGAVLGHNNLANFSGLVNRHYRGANVPDWIRRVARDVDALYARTFPEAWTEQCKWVHPDHVVAPSVSWVSVRISETPWHKDGRDFGLGWIAYLGDFAGGGEFHSANDLPICVRPGDVLCYEPTEWHCGLEWRTGRRIALVCKCKPPFASGRPDVQLPAADWNRPHDSL